MSIFVIPVRLFNEQGDMNPNQPSPKEGGTMKSRVLAATIVFLLITASVWASGAPNVTDTSAAFAQLKSLAGEWESKAADGSKSRTRYEVVSGGSAVVEHFESDALGPANAMLTVYYLEGDHLRLTHYCMARNQPRMQAQSFDKSTGELRFGFLDAANLSGPEAGHMHNATFRFVDADHFATDWQFFEGGKPKITESVQYTRVR
jgi:hypothetical protein